MVLTAVERTRTIYSVIFKFRLTLTIEYQKQLIKLSIKKRTIF